MSKVKLGIIGYGPFGQGVTRCFLETQQVEIVGVYNRGEEKRRLAEEHGYAAYADLADLLAVEGLQAVAVASANCVHAEQCIASAEAGKHIFAEKPLTLDLDSYDAVTAAAESAGVVTHIDFTMRYGALTSRLIEICRSGRLGRLLTLWVRRVRGYGLWSAGARHSAIEDPARSGGWNIHHNVHGTDLLMTMAGERVVEVYARNLRSAADTPTDEINVAVLTFADGAVGTVGDSTSILREGYYGAIGTAGTVLLHADKLTVKMEDGTQAVEEAPSEKALVASCRAFVDACLGRGTGNIPFDRGRHCLEVLLAMNRSSDEGRIIRLPE